MNTQFYPASTKQRKDARAEADSYAKTGEGRDLSASNTVFRFGTNMARFDLNLLSALNALLTEQNVTRASEKLNVTQPTMSGMLQRLRFQFDDPLLVRHGREMELTPFAESLVDPVREALLAVDTLVRTEPTFDPSTSTREFTLMASDYCTAIFLHCVIAHITSISPGIRICIKPINSPIEKLNSGDIDLCITADDLSLFAHEDEGENLHSELLFSDEFVCIVAKDHPLKDSVDIATLMEHPHVGVEMKGAVGTLDAVSLRSHDPHYTPNVVVTDFTLIPHVVAVSKCVGIVQTRLAEVAALALPIRSLRPSFDVPTLNEAMLWHSRHIQDPAHIWLRSLLKEFSQTQFMSSKT